MLSKSEVIVMSLSLSRWVTCRSPADAVVLRFCNVFVLMFADELDGKDVSGPDSFYKVYEPVFERNKRFAVILPAPSLGDDDTPIDEVTNKEGLLLDRVSTYPFIYFHVHVLSASAFPSPRSVRCSGCAYCPTVVIMSQ